MKQSKKTMILILLVLVCTVLLATGTLAAYTSVESVKRVVTTKNVGSDLRFSSNYLSECDSSTAVFPKKTITSTPRGFTIHLTICNYPQNDITKYSESNIDYTLSISLVPDEEIGADPPDVSSLLDLPEGFFGSHSLAGGSAGTDSYTISCSPEQIETLRQYNLRIIATPNIPGLNKILAAELQIITASQNTHWSGELLNPVNPDQDAFNYRISGTAQENVTLTWPADKVALSPWSKTDLGITAPGNSGTATFSVGGEGKPSSYLLQFYKLIDPVTDLIITLSPQS